MHKLQFSWRGGLCDDEINDARILQITWNPGLQKNRSLIYVIVFLE